MTYEYMKTRAGLGALPWECGQKRCPSGQRLHKIDVTYVGSGAQVSRDREQLLRDQGCTYLCSPTTAISGGAQKHYCCPPGAAPVSTAPLTPLTPPTPPPATAVDTEVVDQFSSLGPCSELPGGMRTWTYDRRVPLETLGCRALGTTYNRPMMGGRTYPYPEYCCPPDIKLKQQQAIDALNEQVRQEAARKNREMYGRCIAAGYTTKWEPDVHSLTRSRQLPSHVCHKSGQNYQREATSFDAVLLGGQGPVTVHEVCCHPREELLPELPVAPVEASTAAASHPQNGQPQNGQPQNGEASGGFKLWHLLAAGAAGIALYALLKR